MVTSEPATPSFESRTRTSSPVESSSAREHVGPGELVARRYRLLSPIGTGGQGEVWEASDVVAGERVALKLLRISRAADRARARREIAALRALRIAGVAQLLDEGSHGERIFIVMTRIFGDGFPGRPAPEGWSALAGRTIALLETLARIHALGVAHRDLKPANVLVRADETPVVLDFGLAHWDLYGDARAAGGVLVGTPAYIAPEQISCGPIGPSTDLYSVGAMLYEALVGVLPHAEVPRHAFLRARMSARPLSVRTGRPDLPAGVASTIDALLDPDPAARPRSAREVVRLLRGEANRSTRDLPRVGPADALAAIVRAADEGRSVEVAGPPGSGRTRLLDDAAAELTSRGRRVRRAVAGTHPLSSLEPVVGAMPTGQRLHLAEVETLAELKLRDELASGTVVVADDETTIDAWSRAVLLRALDAGAVVVASVSPATTGAEVVRPARLDEAALRDLFAGHDRLFHLREDAAKVLFSRTGGVPGRVEQEIDAWVRAGLARRLDGRIVVERDDLERLGSGMRVVVADAAPASSRAPSRASWGPHLDELATWVAIGWPNTEVSVLARAMAVDPWRVEAGLAELERRGAVRRVVEGAFEPVATSVEAVDAERRRALHRAFVAALPPGAEGRLGHLLLSDDVASDAVACAVLADEACAVATRELAAGRATRAVVALSDALTAARAASREALATASATERRVLAAWAHAALVEGTQAALDRAAYELCRSSADAQAISALDALVRASLGRATGGQQAADLAAGLAPFDDVRLERQRWEVLVSAAGRSTAGRHEEAVGALESWALGDPACPERRAAAARARATLDYRAGRFEAAARGYLASAEAEPWLTLRIRAMNAAASSLVESGAHRPAFELANDAAALAATCRNSVLEARAARIARMVAYRSGQALSPDDELVEASELVSDPDTRALVAVNEATIAWRAGDDASARRWAATATSQWRSSGWTDGWLLASALAIAAGGDAPARELEKIVETALTTRTRGIGVQALALVAPRCPSARHAFESDRGRLLEGLAGHDLDRRMDVLSLEEALAALSV